MSPLFAVSCYWMACIFSGALTWREEVFAGSVPESQLHAFKLQLIATKASQQMLSLHDSLLFIFFILIKSGAGPSESIGIITIKDDCSHTFWPAIATSTNGSRGFALESSQSAKFTALDKWNGRIWGRTGCNFDSNGNGTCETGSCGTALNCSTLSSYPATLTEFSVSYNSSVLSFFDVTIVSGYNLLVVVPRVNGRGNCSLAVCDDDMVPNCPSEFALVADGKTVRCKNAYQEFGTNERCCYGIFGNPTTCQSTPY